MKGHGWRVAVPVAVLAFVVGTLATRLVSDEQQLRELTAHLRELERACAGAKR